MRLALVALCYLTGTWLGLGSFAFAAALFLWNNLFQPLAFAKRHGEFPVAYYVLVVLVGSYAFNLAKGRFRPRLGLYFYAILAMVLWLLVCTIASPFPGPAWTEFFRLIKYLLPLLLIYTALNRLQEIRLVAAALGASVGVWTAQAGVHCLVSGVSIDLGIPESQLSDRNDFTAGVVGTLPILMYFALTYRGRFRLAARGAAWFTMAMGLVAIVYSDSRGASVGLAATALAYLAFVSKNKIRDLTLGAVLLGAGLFMLPDSWYDRMSTIEIGGEQKEASAQQRWGLMMGALRATTDHPVFGLGPDGWLQVVDIYGDGIHNPHSIYLKLSAEAGFPGLALYLGIMVFTFVRVKRRIDLARRVGDVDGMRLGMALVMCMIGLLAAMSFLNSPFHEYLWAWISLCNAFTVIYRPPKPAKAGAGQPADRRKRPRAVPGGLLPAIVPERPPEAPGAAPSPA